MTATPTVTEAEAIGRASATCLRVMNSEWPAGKGDSIREALDRLCLDLETYRDLLADRAHPSSVYPELEHDPDRYNRALVMCAQDAGDWAAELDWLVPESSDEEGGGLAA